jgi:N-acetylmuramoyl-L-alanine amidase
VGPGPLVRRVAALAVAVLLAACGADDPEAATTTTTAATVAPSATTAPLPPLPPAVAAPDVRGLVTPTGVVVPVLGPAPGGALQVRTPCGATVAVAGGTPLHGATVVLDPGHGGAEPGAVSPSGLAEAGINLAVARHAEDALEAAGVSTLLTRTGDYEVALATRSEIARNVDPKAFVSIHHNAEPDGPWAGPGAETYYQIGSADSKRLAGLVYEEVVKAMSQYKVAWVADRDAGAKYRQGNNGDYYAMLRQPGKVVSVLAELAFISNPPEAELISRPEVQKVEGEAVARGIIRYLTTKDAGSGFTEPYPRPTPPGGTSGPGRGCRDPQL